MSGLGKALIGVGLACVAAGALILLAGRIPWLGKLPGDFLIRRRNVTVYFPLATSLLASALLSLLFWLFARRP